MFDIEVGSDPRNQEYFRPHTPFSGHPDLRDIFAVSLVESIQEGEKVDQPVEVEMHPEVPVVLPQAPNGE